jgi:glycosyltransferase involved in cell wall biosynthesis
MTIRLAAVVSVYNESTFLPDFLKFYSPEVDKIYVLDNESDDGSIAICSKYPNVEVSSYSTKGSFDENIKHASLMEKRHEVSKNYDYTLILDADEFVVPKAGGSIRATIERTKRLDLYGTDGWNIYGYPDDTPYDPARPILDQRKRGVPNEYYSKPIIGKSSIAYNYVLGSHYIKNGSTVVRPAGIHFWLFHLRGFDEEIFIKRAMKWVSRMVGDWPGYYYYNVTEADMRGRITHERNATTVTRVVPADLSAHRSK